MATIIVSPLKTIAEQAVRHRSREMITLIADNQDFHRPGLIDPARHLIVGVNDITFAGKEGLVAPQDIHVAAIIEFARAWDQDHPLLVHCWMGVSRSPAAALIAALAVKPELDDFDIADRLRQASAQASPNTRLVDIGDRLLGREGRLMEAVKKMGRGADYHGDAPFALHF